MIRNMTRWMPAMLLVAAAAGLVARADDDAASADLKKLQGAWVYPNNDGGENRWDIEGDTLKASINGQMYVSKITLNPKAMPRPTADFKITEAPDDSQGKTALGIYELNDQGLKLCFAMPGNPNRPTEFKREEGETVLIQLKRPKS